MKKLRLKGDEINCKNTESVSGGGGGDLNSGLPGPRVHGIATVLCLLTMTTKMTPEPHQAKKGPSGTLQGPG